MTWLQFFEPSVRLRGCRHSLRTFATCGIAADPPELHRAVIALRSMRRHRLQKLDKTSEPKQVGVAVTYLTKMLFAGGRNKDGCALPFLFLICCLPSIAPQRCIVDWQRISLA